MKDSFHEVSFHCESNKSPCFTVRDLYENRKTFYVRITDEKTYTPGISLFLTESQLIELKNSLINEVENVLNRRHS